MIISNDIEQWRHDTFWDKEPETIEWIKSFEPNTVFFDVGANIGIYSLYAASLYSESLIYAFEPVKQNFVRLMQNIELNKFNNIIALPVGISDVDRIDILLIKENIIGHSGYEFFSKKFNTKIQPIFIDSIHHNLHHKYGYLNYGIYFPFWDKIMNTFHHKYEEDKNIFYTEKNAK